MFGIVSIIGRSQFTAVPDFLEYNKSIKKLTVCKEAHIRLPFCQNLLFSDILPV